MIFTIVSSVSDSVVFGKTENFSFRGACDRLRDRDSSGYFSDSAGRVIAIACYTHNRSSSAPDRAHCDVLLMPPELSNASRWRIVQLFDAIDMPAPEPRPPVESGAAEMGLADEIGLTYDLMMS